MHTKPSSWRVLALVLCLFMTLFVLGAFIDSMAFSLRLTNRDGGQLVWPAAFLMKVLTWTWSNVAFLAVLAALLGELGRVASSRTAVHNAPAGALRGFFVYLAAISGQLVLAGNLPVQVTQDAYFRIAGFVSLVSFLVGYSPRYFRGLLAKLLRDDDATNGPTGV